MTLFALEPLTVDMDKMQVLAGADQLLVNDISVSLMFLWKGLVLLLV